MIREHYICRGRVQGCGFRYKASHAARALGLTGYVRNCDDGSEGFALGLEDLPYNLRWSFEGHDVHMQHKPFYALSFPVGDILLFGHTHFKCLYKEHGVIYCNPGSLSLPRDECASYAVFENGTIVLKHGDDGSLISSLSL